MLSRDTEQPPGKHEMEWRGDETCMKSIPSTPVEAFRGQKKDSRSAFLTLTVQRQVERTVFSEEDAKF